MNNILRIYRFIATHPLTRNHQIAAMFRVIKWQLCSRLQPGHHEVRFVENSKLVVKRGMDGATGNIYAGLHDFEDMGFLLHFLRKDDLFGDIGANTGTYSVLSSAVTGARSVAIEPIPTTFSALLENVRVNHCEDLIMALNKGVGEKEGFLQFTNDHDTINHVTDAGSGNNSISIEVTTLDTIFSGKKPVLLKMDVEGYELFTLRGAIETLRSNDLKAIIVELNGSGDRYGYSDADVHYLLTANNFAAYSYLPFERRLESKKVFQQEGNTLYLKDIVFVQNRIETGKKFKVLNKVF